MSTIDPPGTSAPRSTLAGARLPRRVHRVLEQLFSLVSEELARELERLLGEFEQELFRLGERARNPALQSGYMDTLRTVRSHRNDLVPHVLVGLETALSRIRDPAPDAARAPARRAASFQNLQLVEDHETSEATALRLIAVRHESRASLPLMLLGQRFGVLAAAPAFDPERLPVGPQMLAAMLAEASRSLHVNLDSRLLLYRLFDRQLAAGYAQLVEAMNLLLARENVLPGLSYVPLRLRPTAQNRDDGERTGERGNAPAPPDAPARRIVPAAVADRSAPPEPADEAPGKRDAKRDARADDAGARAAGQRAYTGWPGDPDRDAAAGDGQQTFALLQQLLSGRRDQLGEPSRPAGAKPSAAASPTKQRPSLPTNEVIAALGALQSAPTASHPPRSMPDIQQALLAQGRQQRGEAIALSREDSDTFELLGMLYTEIGRELRQGTVSNSLLSRLQVPLLQVALQDRGFFAEQQHPARQLLNAVAEAGAIWRSDDESDPQLNVQLQSAVEHVVENYDGDAGVFESANQQLQQHLQAMARKAEVSERRHVEAARGKEKLEVAKLRAAAVIDAALAGHTLPRFVRTLLCQAWADVLTLILLREGEDSQAWHEHELATHQIIAISSRGAAAPDGLAGRIEHALHLVGYHAEEAGSIAGRLTSRIDEESEDPASRTELAIKLKASARLGEQDSARKKPVLAPRNPREQACYDHACSLPFGTWIEFQTNQQGDVIRRRLAWFSPVTGRALFVNQRGQRVDEQTLDSLSRTMAQGQARVVTVERGRLVDRAWHATVAALRTFGQQEQAQEVSP